MLLLGLGSVAAYRPVGIARKTGYRWHAARGGLPLLRLREDEHGTRYLSLLERRIATLRGQGLTERGGRSTAGPGGVHGQPRVAPPRTTAPATTGTWRMPAPGRGPGGRDRDGEPSPVTCGLWWKPSWSWTGDRSISPGGYD